MITAHVEEFNETLLKELQRCDYDKIIFEKDGLEEKDIKIIQELLEKEYKVTVITDKTSMLNLKKRLLKQIQDKIEIIFDTIKKH